MELSKVAKAWVEMWRYEFNDPKRRQYDWVDDFEYDVVYEKPDLAIDLVLEILKLKPDNQTREVLAAGMLEQTLADHGSNIIDRVEYLSKSKPDFANLLGGVWKNSMSDDIWVRVQSVWDRKGWDGN